MMKTNCSTKQCLWLLIWGVLLPVRKAVHRRYEIPKASYVQKVHLELLVESQAAFSLEFLLQRVISFLCARCKQPSMYLLNTSKWHSSGSRLTFGIFPWKFTCFSCFLLWIASSSHFPRAFTYFKAIYVWNWNLLGIHISVRLVESD